MKYATLSTASALTIAMLLTVSMPSASFAVATTAAKAVVTTTDGYAIDAAGKVTSPDGHYAFTYDRKTGKFYDGKKVIANVPANLKDVASNINAAFDAKAKAAAAAKAAPAYRIDETGKVISKAGKVVALYDSKSGRFVNPTTGKPLGSLYQSTYKKFLAYGTDPVKPTPTTTPGTTPTNSPVVTTAAGYKVSNNHVYETVNGKDYLIGWYNPVNDYTYNADGAMDFSDRRTIIKQAIADAAKVKPTTPGTKTPDYRIDENGHVYYTATGAYMFTFDKKTGKFFDVDHHITEPSYIAEYKRIIAQLDGPKTAVKPIKKDPNCSYTDSGKIISCGVVDPVKPPVEKPTITIKLPAAGSTRVLNGGYVLNSEGAIKTSAGKTVAVIGDDGKLYDANQKPLATSQASAFTQLLNTSSAETTHEPAASSATGSTSTATPAHQTSGGSIQKNSYDPTRDAGSVDYLNNNKDLTEFLKSKAAGSGKSTSSSTTTGPVNSRGTANVDTSAETASEPQYNSGNEGGY